MLCLDERDFIEVNMPSDLGMGSDDGSTLQKKPLTFTLNHLITEDIADPSENLDSRVFQLIENEFPNAAYNSEVSYWDTNNQFDPPMLIRECHGDEEVSLLTDDGILDVLSSRYLPQCINLDLGILDSDDSNILEFSLNACVPPSYPLDRSFRVLPDEAPDEVPVFDTKAKELQNLINFERNRVQLKREKLRLQRLKERVSHGSVNIDDEATVVEVSNHSFPQTFSSDNEIFHLQSIEDKNQSPISDFESLESNADDKKHRVLKVSCRNRSLCFCRTNFFNICLHVYSSVPEGKIQEITRIRNICSALFCIIVVFITLVVLVIIPKPEKSDEQNASGQGNPMACGNVTRIFSDCLCQKRLSKPLTREIINNHAIVADFLASSGVISNSISLTTDPSSCDANNQAVLWVSDVKNYGNNTIPSSTEIFQRYLLAVLYQELNGHNWIRKSNWLSFAPACVWEGIVCSSAKRDIREINLAKNSLTGLLPAAELGFLTSLRKLLMDSNPNLRGSLSTELTTLPNLHALSISDTSLSGSIPTQFGDQLTELHLSSSFLTGSLPTELGLLTWLRRFDVQKNQITGTIPPEIGNLQHLEYINLSWNKLSGTVIEQWNAKFLNTLLINHNEALSGTVPKPPSNLLVHANFAQTSITGTIPEEYCKLKFLDHVVVDCVNSKIKEKCRCCKCMK
jgi:hypothetical protein